MLESRGATGKLRLMRQLNFDGAGGHRLAGWLHEATDRARGAVVFAHCFTCSKDLHMVRRIAGALAEGGLAVLRFDFTGIGQSEGDFAETTLGSDVEDLLLALAALDAETGGGLPLGLIGHSLGGSASLLAAAAEPRVRALAVIAAPLDPAHLSRMLGPELERAARGEGPVPVTIGGRSFPITRSFLDSLERPDLPQVIAGLKRPLLVLQGTEDTTVRIQSSEAIFAAAGQPKAFVPLAGADHLLSRPEDAQRAAEVLDLWFRHNLA
jgi:putative redox protein